MVDTLSIMNDSRLPPLARRSVLRWPFLLLPLPQVCLTFHWASATLSKTPTLPFMESITRTALVPALTSTSCTAAVELAGLQYRSGKYVYVDRVGVTSS